MSQTREENAMTYGVIVTMPCPIEMYDSLHQALIEQTSGNIDGMLFHVGRAVPEGFEVIEVWESKEQSDRYNSEIIWPLTARVWQGQPMGGEPRMEEFEVRGVVIPQANITV
jgi:hypothetical protein